MERIAVINAGSSSIKFAVFEDGETLLFRGQVEKIGVAPSLTVKAPDGSRLVEMTWPKDELDHRKATTTILETARGLLGGKTVQAIGHRVVHGGTHFAAPVAIDARIVAELDALSPLAPLHQPHNLAPIRTIAETAPHIRQIACFDTAFHRSQPDIAQIYAIPAELTASGIRRYGFHGLSYEYVSRRLREAAPALAAGRVIVAHLGNGASLCAIHAGRSVASTMGFTAVDGLMMGTRCGAIDPGVLIYLMDERGMGPRELEDLIYKRSGLLGVSGISSDMKALRASDAPAAELAIDLFAYRVVREIGSLAAALGGLDALVFTGGIGENDSRLRRQVCEACDWLGVGIDPELNAEAAMRIDDGQSGVATLVVPTNEEWMIAHHVADLLGDASAAAPVQPATPSLA